MASEGDPFGSGAHLFVCRIEKGPSGHTKLIFLSGQRVGRFYVGVNLWAGNKYKRPGGEFAHAQHAHGIVYRLLEVADAVMAVLSVPSSQSCVQ